MLMIQLIGQLFWDIDKLNIISHQEMNPFAIYFYFDGDNF